MSIRQTLRVVVLLPLLLLGTVLPLDRSTFLTWANQAPRLAPITHATLSPRPLHTGWNTSPVTVSLQAMARTPHAQVTQITYSLSGAQSSGPVVTPGNAVAVTVTQPGETTVTYFAEDSAGTRGDPEVLTVRIDPTPPVLTALAVDPPTLWPPDGRLVDVAVTYTVTDVSPTACTLGVTSSDRDEHGWPRPRHRARDWHVVDAHHVQLRAELEDGKIERTYTLTVTCTDKAGFTARQEGTASVRFDYAWELAYCADTDGDGFCDTWEDQNYIDLNGNGGYDPALDFAFPHAHFSAVTHTGTGTGVLGPALTDPAAAVPAAAVEIAITAGGAAGVATFTYALDEGEPVGPLATGCAIDLPGNVRLYFTNGYPEPSFVAGDTYRFAAGVNAKVADKDRPNIYVQYDYMGWGSPGPACTVDSECQALGRPNEVCHGGFCNHTHAPADPTFQNVVEAFATHDVRLYIDPVQNEIPHSQVLTFQLASDPAVAHCAGAVPGAVGSYAVNFHDIKNRTTYGGPFDPGRKNVFRYAVFGHYNTCDSATHCGACPEDRSSPPYTPQPMDFGATGVAEFPGNDFMVTLAELYFGAFPTDKAFLPLAEAGTFMHELGHNLGLHHNGDVGLPAYSPNYMSVMNYNYQLTGIMTSLAVGSNTPDGPTRLDYSNSALPVTLNEGNLNESLGVSDISSSNKDIVFFLDGFGNSSIGAGAGPIDWSGDGALESSVQADLNGQNGIYNQYRGYADWMHGACGTSADCPVNNVLTVVNKGVPTREPCVRGRCQPMLYGFQTMPWGLADGQPPAPHLVHSPSPAELRERHSLYPLLPVQILLQPSAPAKGEAFAPANPGEMVVALLGAERFDVAQVEQASLQLHGAKPLWVDMRDVNGDGRPDLVMAFYRYSVQLAPQATRVKLSGWLKSSQAFTGTADLPAQP